MASGPTAASCGGRTTTASTTSSETSGGTPCRSSGGRRTLSRLLLVLVSVVCCTRPAWAQPNAIPSTNALTFLRKYGYLAGGPQQPQPGGGVSVGDRFGSGSSASGASGANTGRPDSETLYTEEAVVDAIRLVQKFGNIPQTGVLDEATEKLMTSKRCGLPDVVRPPAPGLEEYAPAPAHHGHPYRDRRRHKRFALASKGWKKRHLKYYIANWTPKIGEDGVNSEMVKAFDAWSAYGRLRFTRVQQPAEADITVAFGRGAHGDRFPFDGPGGILAHAFYPYEMASYGGDIHFDDDENWAANPNTTELYNGAVDFFMVAVHELGHSLGLGHSPDPDSIMFPYYQSKSNSFALGQDDIMGMYELYIKRHLEEDNETPDITFGNEPPRRPRPRPTTTTTTTTTTTPRPVRTTTRRRPRPTTTTTTTTTTPRPRHPAPPHHPHRPPTPPSAPTFHGDDETVEEHKKHDNKHNIPPSEPGGVPHEVPGGGPGGGGGTSDEEEDENAVPDLCAGGYDAVAQLRGELFVFKGRYLWRLQQRGRVMQGYPVQLHRMFQGLPEHTTRLDAVYQREDGNIVLFSGTRYWVYNGVSFIENSPQHIARYGLPSSLDRIDAVMIWAKNKATYFFRKSEFWRYNTTTSRMDPGYPKRISSSWKRVPNEIDDAMTWTDGITHFFKGDRYYQINNKIVSVENEGNAPRFWFGC